MTHSPSFWEGKHRGLTQAADELAGMITTNQDEHEVLARAERLLREEADAALDRYRELVRFETCDLRMSER